MRSRILGCITTLGALAACQPVPPAKPAPLSAVDISASFGRTWDALIDVFAQRNIPIKTIERVSGLIATDNLRLNTAPGGLFSGADCGTNYMRIRQFPTEATYNGLVRGDSSRSTLRITVRFIRVGSPLEGGAGTVSEECSTTGEWETSLAKDIKTRAEAPRS